MKMIKTLTTLAIVGIAILLVLGLSYAFYGGKPKPKLEASLVTTAFTESQQQYLDGRTRQQSIIMQQLLDRVTALESRVKALESADESTIRTLNNVADIFDSIMAKFKNRDAAIFDMLGRLNSLDARFPMNGVSMVPLMMTSPPIKTP